MNKKFFFLLALIPLALHSYGQADSNITKAIDKSTKQILAEIDKQNKQRTDSTDKKGGPNNETIKPIPFITGTITFLPIIGLLILFIATSRAMGKQNKGLLNFLADKEIKVELKKEETKAAVENAKAVVANAAAYKAANTAPPAVPLLDAPSLSVDPQTENQSVSRLIAFLSGVTTLILAACMASFYFYKSFLGQENVNLGNLSTVLYGLGLGIVPYGFNKIAAAIKPS